MERGTVVVVGYDGSGRARSAVAWAAREAAHRGLPLRLIHALPYAVAPARGPTSSLAGAPGTNHVLAEGIQLARTLMDKDQVSGASLAGHPAGVLGEASTHAALVVVGQRSQDGPVSSAIGSTSLVLADQARCPVVVARGAAGPERALLPVVVGVTGEASPRAALDFAAWTAQSRGVPLTILAAWSLPPTRDWRRATPGFDTVAQWARELAARAAVAVDGSQAYVRLHYPAVATQTRVDRLEAATALARASRRAGLLVVGSGADPKVSVLAPGAVRVARLILGSADCPVAVVP